MVKEKIEMGSEEIRRRTIGRTATYIILIFLIWLKKTHLR